MLHLHREKKIVGENRGEIGRALVTAGRMIILYCSRWDCTTRIRSKGEQFFFILWFELIATFYAKKKS